MADRLDIPAGKGVIVQDVKRGSFAEDIGLRVATLSSRSTSNR